VKQAIGKAARTASASSDNAAAAFAAIAATQRRAPDVTEGRMFGATALKVGGKVFAMLVKGELVVKLPAPRAEALREAGRAHAFDPGHGRIMKEWVAIAATDTDLWKKLGAEGRAFVSGAAKPNGRVSK
jgi:TfoX/Sxy family transcriptional regulator of competence genes